MDKVVNVKDIHFQRKKFCEPKTNEVVTVISELLVSCGGSSDTGLGDKDCIG